MKISRLWNDMLDLRRNKVINDDLVRAIMVAYMNRCMEHVDAKQRQKAAQKEMTICDLCERKPEEFSLF